MRKIIMFIAGIFRRKLAVNIEITGTGYKRKKEEKDNDKKDRRNI